MKTPLTVLPSPLSHGAFTIRDAALYLNATTPPPQCALSDWVRRRDTFIKPSSQHLSSWIRHGLDWESPVRTAHGFSLITFRDLIRFRLIAILRSRGVSYRKIVESEDYVRRLTGKPQPFITEDLWTYASEVFIRFREELIAASLHGQQAMDFLKEFLVPVYHGLAFGADREAVRWSPERGILIDPEIQLGAPCIAGTRVETEVIGALFAAGDSIDRITNAYKLERGQIEHAVNWEKILSRAL